MFWEHILTANWDITVFNKGENIKDQAGLGKHFLGLWVCWII
jgi:hypothetical protein